VEAFFISYKSPQLYRNDYMSQNTPKNISDIPKKVLVPEYLVPKARSSPLSAASPPSPAACSKPRMRFRWSPPRGSSMSAAAVRAIRCNRGQQCAESFTSHALLSFSQISPS
jgi:hypothetical protein